MSSIRFMKRLELGIKHNYTKANEDSYVLGSVREHVTKLLNTRQGSVSTLPKYGLPDFNDIALRFPDSIQELKREIRQCIENYEPRLRNLEIHYVSDEDVNLEMKFEIAADLLVGKNIKNVFLETTMHTSGNVEVRGW